MSWPWRRARTRRSDEDFAEEIRAHLELEADQLRAEGVMPEDAHTLAHRAFGNVTHAQEHFHESRRVRWLEELAQDVRYALRQLRRAPALATVIVSTLALGVGANSVIFGVVDRLLLRAPSGVASPSQLRRLYFRGRSFIGPQGNAMYSSTMTSFATITAMQHVPAFARVAGVQHSTSTLGRGSAAQQVECEAVTGNYFALLGIHPARGRLIEAADDRPPVGAPVVVLSYGFWQRQFSGARDVIGKSLRVDDATLTVIGVAERDFNGIDLENVDLWVPVSTMRSSARPYSSDRDWTSSPSSIWIRAIARIAPKATNASAGASATVLYRRLVRDWRSEGYDDAPDTLSTVIPASIIAARGSEAPQETRISLWLAGVAGIVLIIACANVTNLLLARAFRRRREIAVRLALGVSGWRLVRQLLTETCVLAAIATVVAIIVAIWGGHLVGALLLPESFYGASWMDGRIAAFTAFVAFAAALLAGIAPALQGARIDLAAWLTTGVRDSGRRSRLQLGLLITQAALSVVLLVGAGLFVRSLQRVRGSDVGIDLSRVLLVKMNVDVAGFDSSRVRTIVEQAIGRARRVHGVVHVTLARNGVPKFNSTSMSFDVAGRASLPLLPNGGPYVNMVDDEYFATLGTRVTRGRGIVPEDTHRESHVAVINETLARYYWPNQSPLGACLTLASYKGCTEVVGVVQDVLMWGLINDERGQYYLPRRTSTGSAPPVMLVRTSGDARAVGAALRRELQSLASDMPYVDVQSYADLVEPDMRSWRLGATMFGAFGTLALVIAAVGLYGVLTYAVTQRTREIGVRIALGARRAEIVRFVAIRGVGAVTVGVALGVVLALATAKFVAPMLYRTSPRDPLVIIGVAVSLIVVALVASVVPSWRASRVDPNIALRAE
jgi:putative ABC transport system permease protein